MKILSQSPTEDSFVQNPYRVYAEILTTDKVRYWQDYEMVAVFDAETINAILRNRKYGRALPHGHARVPQDHLRDFDALENVSMLDMEPPSHTRLRGLVLRAFTTRRIRSLTRDIEAICNELIDGFPSGDFDLLGAYCTQLPVRIIARLLGVPETMAPDLLRWSNAMVAMYQAGRTRDTENAANAAAKEFTTFMGEYIDARKSLPRDDLITELIRAQNDHGHLTTQETIGTCVLLLNAGHEATVHTLGNAVKALLEHRTPLHALSPERRVDTVEEVLRFDPPLHIFTRYAYEDHNIGSYSVRTGEQIALVLGAAGRDPDKCKNPDVFDPFRNPASHIAFGGGTHFCVGAPLARLEMQIALAVLFKRVPQLRLAKAPRYADMYHFHGLDELLVSV